MIKKIARIENTLAINAQYKLKAVEHKILYCLIAQIDVTKDNFYIQKIPLSMIVKTLKGGEEKHWGMIYDRIEEMSKSLLSKHITFPSDVTIKGKTFNDYINIFQRISFKSENGVKYIQFKFSEDMIPFLLELKEYVQIYPEEIMPFKSEYAIRMYEVFKAIINKRKKHQQKTEIAYSIVDLKKLLGVDKKYGEFKDFKRYVVDSIKKEINQHSQTFKVAYTVEKSGRTAIGIVFQIEMIGDSKALPVGPDVNIEHLSFSQTRALDLLVKFGVYKSIAVHQIISTIEGSEVKGYEDYFVKYAIKHFKDKAKQKDVQTFVKWWVDKKVFTGDDLWAAFNEKIVIAKKELRISNPVIFENRETAKNTTALVFEQMFEK